MNNQSTNQSLTFDLLSLPDCLAVCLRQLRGQLGLNAAYPLENHLQVPLHLRDVLRMLLEVILRAFQPRGGKAVHIGEHLVGLLESLKHLLLGPHNELHVALVDHPGQALIDFWT